MVWRKKTLGLNRNGVHALNWIVIVLVICCTCIRVDAERNGAMMELFKRQRLAILRGELESHIIIEESLGAWYVSQREVEPKECPKIDCISVDGSCQDGNSDRLCDENLFCKTSVSKSEEEKQGVCTNLMNVGVKGCTKNTDCKNWVAGIICDNGVCKPGRVLGEHCENDDDCELPLVCDKDRMLCTKPWADLGESCAAVPCLLSFFCDRSDPRNPVCRRRPRNREPCNLYTGCEYPYSCLGYCVDTRHSRDLGESCSSTVQCKEGLLCLAKDNREIFGKTCQPPENACAFLNHAKCDTHTGKLACVLPHASANVTISHLAEELNNCFDGNAFHWSGCSSVFMKLVTEFGGLPRWIPCAQWLIVNESSSSSQSSESSHLSLISDSFCVVSSMCMVLATIVIQLLWI